MPAVEGEGQAFEEGGENDLSKGPVTNRGCTDCPCLIILLAAWVGYLVVTFFDAGSGNPHQLYLPRDWKGGYCNTETNWGNNPVNTKGFNVLSYTMNMTATTDLLVKQMMCSTAVKDVMEEKVRTGTLTQAGLDEYNCECCLVPCSSCTGSVPVADITNLNDLSSIIGGQVADLKGAAGNLFDPSKANGDLFTTMWDEATKYFNQVCLTDCSVDYKSIVNGSRTWSYTMSGDNKLKPYWEILKDASSPEIEAVINSQFVFQALPSSLCPYDPSKCIPMPGIDFQDSGGGYCSFKMSQDVVNVVGQAASDVFQSLGGEAFTDNITDSFGQWWGDFLQAIDAFVLVSMCCFIIGFVYLILLRLFVGCCVWAAVLAVLVFLTLGGGLCYVRSFQCAGVGLLETGTQVASATAVLVETSVTNAATGETAAHETLTGDGHDYVGAQYRTKSGHTCQAWDTQTTDIRYRSSTYTTLVGAENHCRNPYLATTTYKAATIWCFTTDSIVKWEECLPIGVVKPECQNGYAVPNEDVRKVLEICGYVIWGIAGIYLILVVCFTGRIWLAISINKVAASFVGQTPLIITVPIVQALTGVLWIAVWCFSASFLISQVPDGYTSKEAYATYAEAYGTSTIPGKCNDKWPTGSVYKDETDCITVNGTVACWFCAPPRYVFDYRFAASFFVFLWNNALLIAIGQCVIAGAVGGWFFTPNEHKGSKPCIRASLYNTFRYHLGSVAMGAFLVALVQFIRAMMKYYEKQAQAAKNRVMVIVLKICQCCLWCFEKCLKFLNKNAYIQIALMGTNFCTSAKNAFWLILRNAVRFGVMAILGSMIHAIGFLFIVSASVGLGYLIVTALHPSMSPAINLVIYGVVAYMVAGLFMSVFGMAVDTTLQCFLACEEMGMGGEFTPPQLSAWLSTAKTKDDSSITE